MNGESYVVRVYRREQKHATRARRDTDRVVLDGIVEEVESGGRGAFHGIEELWRFLARRPAREGPKTRKR